MMFVVTAQRLTVGSQEFVKGSVFPADLSVDYDDLVKHKALTVVDVNSERKNSRRSRKGSEGETPDGGTDEASDG